MEDLYQEAVIEGIKTYREQTQTGVGIALELTTHQKPPTPWNPGRGIVQATMPVLGPKGPGYWIARHAARKAAHAMLNAAEDMGMRTEDLAVLQKVAEEVAYD